MRDVPNVSEETDHLDHVGEIGPSRVQASLDVLPALLGLPARVARADKPAVRVEGNLTRDEDHRAGTDDVRVRLWRCRHADGFHIRELRHGGPPR